MRPPRKQTRRSISIRQDVYERLKRYCDSYGVTMSSIVEDTTRGLIRSDVEIGEPHYSPEAVAKFAHNQHITTRRAATMFGLTPESVANAYYRLYPKTRHST